MQMFDFYQTLIDEHRETLDINNSRDLIDVYLIEIEKAKNEGRAGELFEGRDHGMYRNTYSIIIIILNQYSQKQFKNSYINEMLYYRTATKTNSW